MGDSVEAFHPGDLVFLGSNISHVWYSDEIYYQEKGLQSRALVIYFNKEIFGSHFYDLQETASLRQLLHKAERGMRITGTCNEEVYRILSKLPHAEGMGRIIGLLEILQLLGHTKDYELLASIGFHNTYNTRDNHKIDEVFHYVSQNFSQNITLEDIAKRCHMARHSFCRFFKKRTQKTFIDFLNEFRASHAKKLLLEDEEMTIREIAYQCGFNNISNFNKTFKSLTGTTPKQYREKHRTHSLDLIR